MSWAFDTKTPLPLGQAARDYLRLRAAYQEACAAQLAADIAMSNAEGDLLNAFESAGGSEDTTGIYVDGTVISIREEHWELKPGDRVTVIKTEAA